MQKTYNIKNYYYNAGLWVEPASSNGSITLYVLSNKKHILVYTSDFITWHEIAADESATVNQRVFLYYIYKSDQDDIWDLCHVRGNFNIGGNMCDLIGGTYNSLLPLTQMTSLYNNTYLISAANLTISSLMGNTPHQFSGCTNLIYGPKIKLTLGWSTSYSVLRELFLNCTSLISIPPIELSARDNTLYLDNMFHGCTSLSTTPKFIINGSNVELMCSGVFYGCSSLTTISNNFIDWASLKSANCSSMFAFCTNLEDLTIPACEESYNCASMYYGCSKIKISETQTGEYINSFSITNQNTTLTNMFNVTGGTFTGTPQINTAYYTSNTLK